MFVTPTDNVSLDTVKSPFLSLSHNQFETLNNISTDVLSFIPIYSNITSLCLSRFKWDFDNPNLNDDREYIEKMLHYKGRCAIVNDENKGYISCDFIVSKWDRSGRPQLIKAVNGYNQSDVYGEYVVDDFVILKNNSFQYPTNLTAYLYSSLISQLNVLSMKNIEQQKFPVVFQGTPEQKQTLAEVSSKLKNGDIYIFLDKSFNINDITKLSIDIKFLVPEIMDTKDRLKNEMLTLLGFDNVNVSKESGISTDEVNANNGIIAVTVEDMLESRLKAGEELKNKFNINASVNIKGGDTDESIHDIT